MITKTLVIFANSVKHHEHCVAGKDVLTKEWIRPVGDKNGCELTDDQIRYQNKYGKYLVKPLQKMNIDFIERAPLKQQPENYVVSNKIWTQNYKIEREDIENYLDNPNDLWLDGTSKNDRVNYNFIVNNTLVISQSLYLIKVNGLTIQKEDRRAIFKYNGVGYVLAITDPGLKCVDEGLDFYYLVISLGEEFQGNCYKLVASIL